MSRLDDILMVQVRPPRQGPDLARSLVRLGATSLGGGVYLVPDLGSTERALRALAIEIERRGGCVLLGRGSTLSFVEGRAPRRRAPRPRER